MNRSRIRNTVALILVLATPTAPTWSASPEPLPTTRAGETDAQGAGLSNAAQFDEETGGTGGQVDEDVNQTPAEALEADLLATAEGNGWTVDEAESRFLAAEDVGEVAEEVANARPDVFVGSALGTVPGEPPRLYIKGPADAFVLDTVAASEVSILIVDRQPYSFEELEARKLLAHHALVDLGFRNVATSVNVTGAGVIPAAVTAEAGLPRDPSVILELLPADIRDSVSLSVNNDPVVEDEAAFGGMQMRDGGANECTSGFSVRSDAANTPGITTAGHCDGIDQIVHPGHAVHATSHRAEHRGQFGDVEWKTTTTTEPDDFHASATMIRDVAAIEARSRISVNESICVYGRASDSRDCSLEVQDVSQACTNSGVFNDRLVLMNGDTQIPGDSGSPWYYVNTAFGIHKGQCNPNFSNREAFSVAALFDEVLGIRVTCGC